MYTQKNNCSTFTVSVCRLKMHVLTVDALLSKHITGGEGKWTGTKTDS